jgi:hypothetical protein
MALGADAFHGNLTMTGNQTDPTAVIPGTQVQITVADNPQTYNARIPNTYVPGTSITFSQLNWSVTLGTGLDLTTGSPWTWDNSLVSGFPPEYVFFYDSTSGGERIVGRRAFQLVQVEPLPKPKTIVGIEATSCTLGTLSFAAPSYGASNNYTISLGSGTDADGTTTALADGSSYLLQSNSGLGIPAAYQFTVIPGGAWRAAANNHWENGANWSGGGVPDANYTALFDIASPVPPTPVLYKNESVKTVRLETANAGVTIGKSGGDWRLSVGTGGIKSTGAGTNTISAGVTLSANAAVNVATGNTLAIAGGADAGGHTMNKEGPGTLVLGTQTHTAGSTLNVNQGTVTFGGTQRLGTLNVNAGLAQVTLGGAKVLVADALSISPSAQLDLTDNDMIVKYTGGTPQVPSPALANVRQLISAGYAGMHWDGNGLISSEAAPNPITTGLGYAQNDMLFMPWDVFSGENVNPATMGTILVKYTYLGDLNLDGVVDDNDVTILNLFYDPTVPGRYWHQGDIFGYDGLVNDNDVTVLGLTYGLGLPGNGEPLSAGAPAAVPEPATLALVGLGALALLRRRSK